VLFELLTPEEHLRFFYDLKGAQDDEGTRNEEIEMLMEDIGVMDKRNSMAY
jgi:ABC-type multidrug transport system ATPase subunit